MKIVSGILAALMILIIPFGINAEATTPDDPYGVMPAFDYISDAGCTLYITESGKASFTSDINGYSDVLMIEVFVRLQRKVGNTWKDVATNSVVAYDDFACCEGTYYLVDRGVYRTETTFTVYTADDLETVVGYSSQVTF